MFHVARKRDLFAECKNIIFPRDLFAVERVNKLYCHKKVSRDNVIIIAKKPDNCYE